MKKYEEYQSSTNNEALNCNEDCAAISLRYKKLREDGLYEVAEDFGFVTVGEANEILKNPEDRMNVTDSGLWIEDAYDRIFASECNANGDIIPLVEIKELDELHYEYISHEYSNDIRKIGFIEFFKKGLPSIIVRNVFGMDSKKHIVTFSYDERGREIESNIISSLNNVKMRSKILSDTTRILTFYNDDERESRSKVIKNEKPIYNITTKWDNNFDKKLYSILRDINSGQIFEINKFMYYPNGDKAIFTAHVCQYIK